MGKCLPIPKLPQLPTLLNIFCQKILLMEAKEAIIQRKVPAPAKANLPFGRRGAPTHLPHFHRRNLRIVPKPEPDSPTLSAAEKGRKQNRKIRRTDAQAWKLVEENYGLSINALKKIRMVSTSGVDRNDARQLFMFHLHYCAKRLDKKRAKISTYFYATIKKVYPSLLGSFGPIKLDADTLYKAWKYIQWKKQNPKLGIEDYADEKKLTFKYAQKIARMADLWESTMNPCSFEKNVFQPESSEEEPGEFFMRREMGILLADDVQFSRIQQTPEDLLIEKDTRHKIKKAVQGALLRLSSRERKIVMLRIQSEAETGKAVPFEAIADDMGLSRAYIQILYVNALRKMRPHLRNFKRSIE